MRIVLKKWYETNISATSLLLFQTKIYEKTQYPGEQYIEWGKQYIDNENCFYGAISIFAKNDSLHNS